MIDASWAAVSAASRRWVTSRTAAETRMPSSVSMVDAHHRVRRRLQQPREPCLRAFAVGDVPDRGGDQDAFLGVDGGQGDLGGEGGAVAAAPGQFHPRAHRAGPRVSHVPGPSAGVDVADRVRDEHFHRLADQLVPPVAEQPLGLRVDQRDPPVAVDAHHRVRRRLQQPREPVIVKMHHSHHPPVWPASYLMS